WSQDGYRIARPQRVPVATRWSTICVGVAGGGTGMPARGPQSRSRGAVWPCAVGVRQRDCPSPRSENVVGSIPIRPSSAGHLARIDDTVLASRFAIFAATLAGSHTLPACAFWRHVLYWR